MDSAEFAPFQAKLTSALVQVTRTVGQLSSEDLNFHRTSSAEFSESLDEQSERIIALTSAVIKAATAGTDVTGPTLHDEDSVEDNWRGVVDVIDSLLEKADACLDEFTGVIKKLSPSQEEQAPAVKKGPNFPTIYDFGPSKIPKPQLEFERKPDNTNVEPFKPLLKSKPHAIVPLEKCLKTKKIDGVKSYPHPYETEIRESQYPKSVYEVSPPVDYLPFESTTATFVDTLDGVKEMLKELKKAKEIAIDLEHHDVHSYHGLVSLMQISTREKDWVVDTLKPWREELQMLNEVFTDPKILKVLHGSTMDIIWLQRDLGLYVVGMFDTFHAASALGFPKRSLKYLLNKFVNFEADKRYQTADWRARPLPTGMFDYARSDTHYLLYIYDCLRNDLIENSTEEASHIDYVNEGSKKEALQRYERPIYDAVNGHGPGGWYDLLWRNSGNLPKEQFAVFKAVHKFRDEVARAEDEGWQCVFPKHMLFKLAQTMPLDLGTLFRTISPVTPITKARAPELLEAIKQAKVASIDGPEWNDVTPPKHLTKGGEAKPSALDLSNVPIAGRYETSQFWGDVLEAKESPPPAAYSLAAGAEALRLSLPLPPMPATVSQARDDLGTAAKPVAPEVTPSPTPQEPEATKYFTVKDLGGPRKRKVTPVNNPEQALSTTADLDDTSNDPDSTEKQSKKSRKEKKAKKSKSKTQSDEAAFDYGAADAVLNAPSAAAAAQPRRKAFNPYAKAMEAPSGARKTKREIPGKSLTFRQ
jgi:exosome complex exonuclease RRP6